MATLFSASLILTRPIGYNDFREYRQSLSFEQNVEDIDFKNDVIKVKEYNDLKISISSEKSARLYFDGFDIIESEILKEDKNGEKYLENGAIDLVKYKNNKANNILVPGYYLIKVKCGQTFFSIIEIVPKDFEKEEWKDLYKEIKKFFSYSAKPLLNRSNAKMINANSKNTEIDKLNYLMDHRNIILKALTTLKRNRKSKIVKNYNWVNENLQPRIDKQTIKMRTKYPEKGNSLYSCKRDIEYNTPENIWMKKALVYLSKSIDNTMKYLEATVEEKEIQKSSRFISDQENASYVIMRTKKSIEKLQQIRHALILLLKESWVKNIEYNRKVVSPGTTLLNSEYNIIYKWYKEFNKNSLEMIFSKSLQRTWKRTDELYEVWCFIKVIELFKYLNFDMDISQLYQENEIDVLKEETHIEMINEQMTVNIHFNSTLKSDSNDTSNLHPLYTSNKKNKPDIRVDIFVNNVYIKSIPIEVKYRKLKQIADNNKGVLTQLMAYKDSPKSKFHLPGAKPFRRRNHTVINKVIVFFPRDEVSRVNTKNLTDDFGLEFIELSPNYNDERFLDLMREELQEVNDIYTDIYE
ncbi:nuclease domain-containing protein [Staphylococcus simulans]|uniref:nuclease domain-containing protein n=1 Tax=Staphylococcus simulans TaxID=1286 RepID=UPI0021D41309|nr:nuclease domain-containing protein [Staphylococcus simulans]UXR33020.1 hypothetical protein MUA81_01270 [Staphylococcus simulans]